MRLMMAFGLTLTLVACGGQSTEEATGGSAGTGGGGSGGAGGTSGGSGGVGGVGGSGAVSGSGGAGGSGGSVVDACNDPALKSCSGPGQCALATSDCCLCGMPEITDYVAMNQASAAKCNCAGPICDCAAAQNPNLAASCENAQCVAWDVRQRDDYSGCKVDSDCRLRAGLGCCEDCLVPPGFIVAVRTGSEAELKQAMCAPNTACSKCMVQYPPNAAAVCSGGHCQVVFAK